MKEREKKYNYVYNQIRVNGEYYIGIHSTDNMDDNYNGSGTVFKRKYKGDPDSFTKTIFMLQGHTRPSSQHRRIPSNRRNH